jgi:hypothetical protein
MGDECLDRDDVSYRRPVRELILLELYRSVDRRNYYTLGRDPRAELERRRHVELRETFEKMPYDQNL